jgi:hypothetical protein
MHSLPRGIELLSLKFAFKNLKSPGSEFNGFASRDDERFWSTEVLEE